MEALQAPRSPTRQKALDEITLRLQAKVASQASELKALDDALEEARREADYLRDRNRELAENALKMSNQSHAAMASRKGESSAITAQRKVERKLKDELDAMQKLLDATETRLVDSQKSKAKLTHDFDALTREKKIIEKKCNDLSRENQRLKKSCETYQSLDRSWGAGTGGGTSIGDQQPNRRGPQNTPAKSADQIRQLRNTIENTLADLDEAKENEHNLKQRIKTLEEALEFRAVDLGQAGHADLLMKLAGMRGEVAALKDDLGAKRQRLESVEQERAALVGREDALKRQVSLIQQKLSSNQEELNRLKKGDVFGQLRDIEQERDVLLDFIESDMEKGVMMGKRIEELEKALRATKQAADRYEERANTTEIHVEKSRGLEDNLTRTELRNAEIKKAYDLAKIEIASLKAQIEGYIKENTVMSSTKAALIAEEDVSSQLQRELRVARNKIAEVEHHNTALQLDYDALLERMRGKEAELLRTRESLSNVEPLIGNMQPEIKRLRDEMESMRMEKRELIGELTRLRDVKTAVDDLNNDVMTATAMQLSSARPYPQSPEGRSQRHISSTSSTSGRIGNPSLANVERNVLHDRDSAAAQAHSAWIGTPSLRQLSPVLYDNIRRLAQDLYKRETQCHELEAKIRDMKMVHASMEESVVRQKAIASNSIEKQSTSMEYYKKRADDADAEIMRLRSSKTTLDQIRYLLLSYPGGLMQLESLLRQPPNLTGRPGSATAPFAIPLKSEEDLKKIPDQYLPDIIGRALVSNASSVMGAQAVGAELSENKSQVMELHAQLSAATAENAELRGNLNNLESLFQSKDEETSNTEKELRNELDSAVELVEKQNALTATLEAKLESMKRDRQLKGAQVISLQQKEEALRHRILKCCEDAAGKVGVAPYSIPTIDAKLPDIFAFYVQLFYKAAASAGMRISSDAPLYADINASSLHTHASLDALREAKSDPAYDKTSQGHNWVPQQQNEGSRFTSPARSARQGVSGGGGATGAAGSVSNAGHVSFDLTMDKVGSAMPTLLHDRLQRAQQAFASLHES